MAASRLLRKRMILLSWPNEIQLRATISSSYAALLSLAFLAIGVIQATAQEQSVFVAKDTETNVGTRPILLQESVATAIIDMSKVIASKKFEDRPTICVGASINVDEKAVAAGFAASDLESDTFRKVKQYFGDRIYLSQLSSCIVGTRAALDEYGRDAWLITYEDTDVAIVELFAHFNKPMPKLVPRYSLDTNREEPDTRRIWPGATFSEGKRADWDGYGEIDHDGRPQYYDYDFLERDGAVQIKRRDEEMIIQ